jgi:DNA-binding MarR family transcriptional regulator
VGHVTTAKDRLADSLVSVVRSMAGMAIRTAGHGPVPLTLVQHRVLVLLQDAGTLSVNAVATGLGVDQSNASRHCTRLAELGLVRRTPAAHDRRSVELRLTRAGQAQVQAVDGVRRRWAESVLGRLSEEDLQEALRGMEILAQMVGSANEPSPLF